MAAQKRREVRTAVQIIEEMLNSALIDGEFLSGDRALCSLSGLAPSWGSFMMLPVAGVDFILFVLALAVSIRDLAHIRTMRQYRTPSLYGVLVKHSVLYFSM